MKELSLNILDITENSVKAGAHLTVIELTEDDERLTVTITDDGCGMTAEVLRGVEDPFYTTRTTRKVGMGIPLLKMAAEQTGGSFKIVPKHEDEYPTEHGTSVTAQFFKNHLDFTPIGDIPATISTLIQGHPDTDFQLCHKYGENEVSLDTREMRVMLEGIPLNSYEVIKWAEDYLREQYDSLYKQ